MGYDPTSDRHGIARIPVESQPTAFRDNSEFRFFDRFDGVSQGDQIVYKLTFPNAVNITKRLVNLWVGGREYLVYPDSPSHTVPPALSVTGRVSPLNNRLRAGLSSHPASSVVIERADGSGIWSTTDLPETGTGILTDSNTNRAASQFSPSQEPFGIAAGSVIWVVLEHIGGNNPTSGQYELEWEEEF